MDTDSNPIGIRAKRRKENKKETEYVIKTSLVSSLKNKDVNFIEIFKDNIDKRVLEMSKGVVRLSFALNLMIRATTVKRFIDKYW